MRTVSCAEPRRIGTQRARRAALFLLTVALVIGAAVGAVPPSAADDLPGAWPATCVAFNDLVEASLGRPENVGLYQRVYGEQAEHACQTDHRSDVQAAFAWATHSASDPEPVEPAPGGWPATCVALNDIVEASLGRPENVGLYQRAHGDQAEQACQTDHRADVQAAFHWALPPPKPEPEPTPYAPVVTRVFEQPSHECTTDDVDAPSVRLRSPLVSSFTLEATVQQQQNLSVVDFVMRLPQFNEFDSLVGTELAHAVPREYAPQKPWAQSRFERLTLTSYISSIVPSWSSVIFSWYKAQNELQSGGGHGTHPIYGSGILDPRIPYRLRLSYNNGNAALYVNEERQYFLDQGRSSEWLVKGLPYPWVVVEIGCRGLVTLSDIRIDGIVVNEHDVRDLLSESPSRSRPDPSSLAVLGRRPDFNCDSSNFRSLFDFPPVSSFIFEATLHNKSHFSDAVIRLVFPSVNTLSDVVGADLARKVPPEYAPRGNGPSLRYDSLEFVRGGKHTFSWYVTRLAHRQNDLERPSFEHSLISSETGTRFLDLRRPYKLRLSYENGHIVLYINGQLKHTEKGLPYPWMTLRLDCNDGEVTFSNIMIDGVGVDEQRVRDFLNQLAMTRGT